MKKLILAIVALAFAFAISSCCDQSYCPGNNRCGERGERGRQGDETPYRWDNQGDQQQQQQPGQERQHRRW